MIFPSGDYQLDDDPERVDRGPGARFRWALHTADAHGLYRQFGFAPPDETYLERRRP